MLFWSDVESVGSAVIGPFDRRRCHWTKLGYILVHIFTALALTSGKLKMHLNEFKRLAKVSKVSDLTILPTILIE